MLGISRKIRRLYRRYVLNCDLEETEREVLEVLAEGKGREERAWRIAARKTGDEEMERKAREAAMETIRLTRLVNGVADLYSYGRGSDGRAPND